jgi:hypothetical protein
MGPEREAAHFSGYLGGEMNALLSLSDCVFVGRS